MKYNPDIHHRQSIRLKEYDYAHSGAYFITICTQNCARLFGEIVDGVMVLNECGQIAYDEWFRLSERFSVKPGVFVVMPNHVHGIIEIVGKNERNSEEDWGRDESRAPARDAPTDIVWEQTAGNYVNDGDGRDTEEDWTRVNRAPTDGNIVGASLAGALVMNKGTRLRTVGEVIGAYKSFVANGCLQIYKEKDEYLGRLWQRNFYEHIIRNSKEYHEISEYIINNPMRWQDDKYFE